MKISAVLFDADGVLTLPEEVFSVVYARSRGLNDEPFEHFFKTEWRDFVTGRRDLKQAIAENPELWQWGGDVDSLLEYWFKTEDIRNEPLITLIRQLRQRGLPSYLATEQEKHRANYMKTVMFNGLFSDYFVTCDIGYKKSESEFYRAIIRLLQIDQPALLPHEVVFFDDDQAKIDTAHSVGINAHLYTSVDHVKEVLSDWVS